MDFKKPIAEFRAMLKGCGHDVSKLSKLLRNRYGLNQAAMGSLLGLHRNAVIRLESGKSLNRKKWLRDLFFVVLAYHNNGLLEDIASLREDAKNKIGPDIAEEKSGLFKDFASMLDGKGQNVAGLSVFLRDRYSLTQEGLSRLLGVDRTTVSQMEGNKHKHPERLLTGLYLSFCSLTEPGLKEFILSLESEEAKIQRKAKKTGKPEALKNPEEPRIGQENINMPEMENTMDRGSASAVPGHVEPTLQEIVPTEPLSTKSEATEEGINLQRYGFRTRQELYNTMRHGALSLDEKRRLSIIETLWTDDLKKEEGKKLLRARITAVKEKITRELFDRTDNNRLSFLRAANSYRKGRSVAEISQENNGYFTLPFCRLWERHGFDTERFLAWRPDEAETYEIYKDYEPEFKRDSLEHRFMPKKTPKLPKEEKDKNLRALLKEWFPALEEELNAGL